MKISARNVLPGTVTEINKGAVNAEVAISLRGGGEVVVSIITNASVDRLGLQKGIEAFAIIKASDVMVAKNLENARISARNILPGVVVEVHDGTVNSEVDIRLLGGTIIASTNTKESVLALQLKRDDEVSAVIKASHVMVGV